MADVFEMDMELNGVFFSVRKSDWERETGMCYMFENKHLKLPLCSSEFLTVHPCS